MTNYIGVKCPICGKKYTQNDDIVVCPACGAPHHRECYAKNNECAFAADHLSGKEWRPPAAEPVHDAPKDYDAPANADIITCPRCGATNLGGAVFCQICGRPVAGGGAPESGAAPQEPPAFPLYPAMRFDASQLIYGGLSPDEKIDGETARDLAVYVGPNSAYYLPRFKLMDRELRTLSFNIAALLFNFLYFFYRKMYLVGTFLLALFIIGAIPGFLQAWEMLPAIMYEWNLGPEASANQAVVNHYYTLINISRSINFAIGLIVSFCANRFYYSKAISDVKKSREAITDSLGEREYEEKLSRMGGVSKNSVIVVVSAIFAAYFLVASVFSYLFVGGLAP